MGLEVKQSSLRINVSSQVMKTNDWDQPEIQYSTGASNQINYITPVVQSDDIKAWPLLVTMIAVLEAQAVLERELLLHHRSGHCRCSGPKKHTSVSLTSAPT